MADTNEDKVALIVGASRGLGLGLVKAYLSRGWKVIATVRDERGRQALANAAGKDAALSIMQLDINKPDEIATLRQSLEGNELDVLFINAGIMNHPGATPIEDVSTDDFVNVMVTNAVSPMRVIAALHDLVKPQGVVAAMSSNLASISGNDSGGAEVYRASKTALNQLMQSFGLRQKGERTYLLVSPGWVRTDMGGESAPLDVETSAAGIVDTLAARYGTGGVHFVDYRNEIVPW